MEKTLCFVINNIELFLDINIVTFDIPLLFICSDKDNQKYLVLCSDSQELRYLVARIDNSILIKMLKSEITMKDAFKHSNKIFWHNNLSDSHFVYPDWHITIIQRIHKRRSYIVRL